MPVNPPPAVYKMRRYRVTNVPDDCTTYTEGDNVDVFVPDPPPASMQLNPGGACDGVVVVYDPPTVDEGA